MTSLDSSAMSKPGSVAISFLFSLPVALAATPKRRDRRSGVGGIDYEGMAAELDRYKTLSKQLQNDLRTVRKIGLVHSPFLHTMFMFD